MPPTYYDNVPVVEVEYSLTEDEYASASREAYKSTSIFKTDILCLIFAGLFAFQGTYAVFTETNSLQRINPNNVFFTLVGIAVIITILIKWEAIEKKRKEIYRTGIIFGENTNLCIYRDSYVTKNKYREENIFYSKMIAYRENKEVFVLIYEQGKGVAFPKRVMTEEQIIKAREIFRFTFKKAKR